MADLATLQQKYEPVLKAIDRFSPEGAALQDVAMDGDRLYVKATLPSQVALNFVWDQIRSVDPDHPDLHHELVNTGGEGQLYTAKAGDMLSKLADHFYGDAELADLIAQANHVDNANALPAGTLLQIPVKT